MQKDLFRILKYKEPLAIPAKKGSKNYSVIFNEMSNRIINK